MITVVKPLTKEHTLTIEDMNAGDTFLILHRDWDGVYLMTDNEIFVDILDGSAYDVYEYSEYGVRRVDFKLIPQ